MITEIKPFIVLSAFNYIIDIIDRYHDMSSHATDRWPKLILLQYL